MILRNLLGPAPLTDVSANEHAAFGELHGSVASVADELAVER